MKLIHPRFATYSSRQKTDMGVRSSFCGLMPSGSMATAGFSSKARKSKISFSKQGFPGELSEPHLFRPPVSRAGGAAPVSATERNAGRRSLIVVRASPEWCWPKPVRSAPRSAHAVSMVARATSTRCACRGQGRKRRAKKCGAALMCRAAFPSGEMRNLLRVSSPCRPCRRRASPALPVFPSAIRQP
jgi:hypothetical protein